MARAGETASLISVPFVAPVVALVLAGLLPAPRQKAAAALLAGKLRFLLLLGVRGLGRLRLPDFLRPRGAAVGRLRLALRNLGLLLRGKRLGRAFGEARERVPDLAHGPEQPAREAVRRVPAGGQVAG